jgi:hypothetical protein
MSVEISVTPNYSGRAPNLASLAKLGERIQNRPSFIWTGTGTGTGTDFERLNMYTQAGGKPLHTETLAFLLLIVMPVD